MLYLAANMQYYVHPIVDVPTMDMEVLTLEKLDLNMQNYKYAGFDSVRIKHGLNQMKLSAYGSQCGI